MVAPLREALRQGFKSPVLVAPTGSGKTVIFSFMVSEAIKRGRRIIVMVHREELIDQICATLEQFDVPHGRISAGGHYDRRYLAHVASVQTLVRRLERVVPPDGVIVDEAHHCIGATSHGKVATFFRAKNPAMWTIGVTATPERLSGEGLGEMFDHMVVGPTVAELMEAGWLSKYRLFAPQTVDLSGLHTRAGEFVRGEAAEIMGKPQIIGNVVSHYARLCNGAPGVAFCPSVEHSEKTAERFRQYGFRAMSIDGTMAKEVRRSIVADFRRGAINVLASCDLISEGFDLPGIHAAMLLRPTQSMALHLQQIGRSLRPAPGKDAAIILDHVGNTVRHGLPDDHREWTLAGRADREKKEGAAANDAVRQCLKCFAISPAFAVRCRDCGEEFPAKTRNVEEVEGELAEIAIQQARRQAKMEQGRASSQEALMELAQRRGYKNPAQWANMILAFRRQKGRRTEAR